jgi:glycosyltransferase involved in cell wall biosynthesis
MQITLSVIIPSFNREQTVLQAIESCLSIHKFDLEVIVVDDGSTDNTKHIVESLDDGRVRYIYQENSGAPKARNVGAKLALGDFLLFLDSDDTVRAADLERAIEYSRAQLQAENKANILLCGGCRIVSKSGDVMSEWPLLPDVRKRRGRLSINSIFVDNPPTSSVVYQAAQFRRIGGFLEGLTILQDYEISVRSFLTGFEFHVGDFDIYEMRVGAEDRVSSVSSHKKARDQSRLLAAQCRDVRRLKTASKKQLLFALKIRATMQARILKRSGFPIYAARALRVASLASRRSSIQTIKYRLLCYFGL